MESLLPVNHFKSNVAFLVYQRTGILLQIIYWAAKKDNLLQGPDRKMHNNIKGGHDEG